MPKKSKRDIESCIFMDNKSQTTSSRRLEQEAHRNMEAVWLLRNLRPDFMRKRNVIANLTQGDKN